MLNDDYCGWYPYKESYKTYCGKFINRKPKNFIYCPFCGYPIELLGYKEPHTISPKSERGREKLKSVRNREKSYEKESSSSASDNDTYRNVSGAG